MSVRIGLDRQIKSYILELREDDEKYPEKIKYNQLFVMSSQYNPVHELSVKLSIFT
jgi:hypothetical protein